VTDQQEKSDLELHLNFSLTQEELKDSRLGLERFHEVVQLDPDEVRDIAKCESAEIAIGSVGKGASNWGVDVVLVAKVFGGIGATINLGERILKVVRWVRKKRPGSGLVLRDAQTVGVIALGNYSSKRKLKNGTLLGTYCVTGSNTGIGFDSRDVWVTLIVKQDGSLLLIWTSSNGAPLGEQLIDPPVSVV